MFMAAATGFEQQQSMILTGQGMVLPLGLAPGAGRYSRFRFGNSSVLHGFGGGSDPAHIR